MKLGPPAGAEFAKAFGGILQKLYCDNNMNY
jgi:hypothetical protein